MIRLFVYKQVYFKIGLNLSRFIIIIRCLNQSNNNQGILYKARIT
jgi:hypothetical protein